MRPASLPIRFAWILAIAFAAAGGLSAGTDASARAAPSRPTAPAKPIVARRAAARTPQVSVTEIAAHLGLKGHWTSLGRKITLSDGTRRLELEAESRECLVDGLRFFLGEPVVARKEQLYVTETDFRNCLVPLFKPALLGHPPARPRVIALDPGHGGSDNGTENPKLGYKEKVFTLDVALRLKKVLEARHYRVVLTRETDEKLELPQRALIANHAGADLFLSIHFNSLFPDTTTTGAEVFTFTRPGQRSDSSRGFGQPDDTESDAAPVNRYDPWSVAFADALHRHTLAALKLPDRGQKTKHLGMMRGLNCPAALIESGFLSNEQEARKIATPEYRQRIADALAAAVDDYADRIASLHDRG